jgi:hypothetical protein
VDQLAAAAHLLVERVAEVEHAADEDGHAEEDADLRAPVDLAQQLARELAQEDLGVVAARGGGGLDGGGLDEGRDARAAARGGGDGRQVPDGEELHPHVEGPEAKLVAVVNLRAARDGAAVEGDADFGVELVDAEV